MNTMTSHPLIPNANQYMLEKRYVSIHSEDRNVLKYPDSSEFEIELPQDYLNIASVRLSTWSFPANYSVFSVFNSNVTMSFKFLAPYDPVTNGNDDTLDQAIWAGIAENIDNEYKIIVEPGFYNPAQMATELTNKMNEAVSLKLIEFFTDNPDFQYALQLFSSYTRFQVVYNTVQQNLWFGNTADRFVISNDSVTAYDVKTVSNQCLRKNVQPVFTNWGMPAYLGFTRCPVEAMSAAEINEISSGTTTGALYNPNLARYVFNGETVLVPRFYYGDALVDGDGGYWLLPTLRGASVYFATPPLKINFMGPSYLYMEIEGLNCIDETVPYNISTFTTQTNGTNGIVNGSFAKISVNSSPIAQWFDQSQMPYHWYNPPKDRIRRLRFKFRYHNGQLCSFGLFPFSFTLEFNLLNPQIPRSIAEKTDIAQFMV